jgi:tripartite-type tricarboxylate transporter receptor subunit TctC
MHDADAGGKSVNVFETCRSTPRKTSRRFLYWPPRHMSSSCIRACRRFQSRSLLRLRKARPGKLNYASGGNGTNFHVAAELFKHQTGTQIAHVPYKGGGPALASVLGGETDITIASLGAALPHVNSGRVRVLAITSAERSSLMPHIPTVAESGVRDYVFTSWVGALVPAATPPAIVATLNSIVVKAVRSPEVANRLVSDGTQIIGSSPEQFAALIRSEIPRWAKVVKAGNIQPL